MKKKGLIITLIIASSILLILFCIHIYFNIGINYDIYYKDSDYFVYDGEKYYEFYNFYDGYNENDDYYLHPSYLNSDYHKVGKCYWGLYGVLLNAYALDNDEEKDVLFVFSSKDSIMEIFIKENCMIKEEEILFIKYDKYKTNINISLESDAFEKCNELSIEQLSENNFIRSRIRVDLITLNYAYCDATIYYKDEKFYFGINNNLLILNNKYNKEIFELLMEFDESTYNKILN